MKRSAPSKGVYVIYLLALLVVAGGLYVGFRHFSNSANSSKVPTETSSGYVNLNRPTAQDKADTESHKQSLAANADSNQSSSNSTPAQATDTKQKVTPVITTYSQDENNLVVNGFVQGVVEDGGQCTLKLVGQSKTVTQSRQAVINATNTSCGQIDVPLNSLSPGIWHATLNYSSSTSTGVSESKDITVN